ncbi:MAG: hypothetical protein LBP35_01795 [Candidatus Ancillula trichonymphae]|jgi:hypothetical protein|nr:hypothetical protein [Candidatus Ancillula trichonymphae]
MELTEEQVVDKFRRADRILVFAYCNRSEDAEKYWNSNALLGVEPDFSSCFVSLKEGCDELDVNCCVNLEENISKALSEGDAFLSRCEVRDSEALAEAEDALLPEVIDGSFTLVMMKAIRDNESEQLKLVETFNISQNMARHLSDLKNGFCSKIQL